MSIKHTNPTEPRRDSKNGVWQWARAPYNFIPLADRVVPARPPLNHDEYSRDGVSCIIECELETYSPTYVRSIYTKELFDMLELAKGENLTIEQKEKIAPFSSLLSEVVEGYGVPMIPGSTLRGMVRALVEIIGYGRIQNISDVPTFTFRAVAASQDDPLRDSYRELVGQFARNVRAGYLRKDGNTWRIRPAQMPSTLGLPEKGAFIKVKEHRIKGRAIPGYIRLDNIDNYRPQIHEVSFSTEPGRGKQDPYTNVTNIGSRANNYSYQGTLITSGNMLETAKPGQKSPRKNHALILMPDERADELTIRPQAIKDYLNGLTPYQKEKLTDWGKHEQGVLQDGAPIFYVPEGNEVAFFGHSPNFRVPAQLAFAGAERASTPRDFIPTAMRQMEGPDLAESIFGWVENELSGVKKQRAGRVFFTDAKFIGAEEGVWLHNEPITPKILSSPKPTTFQHYLVQDHKSSHNPDDKKSLAHYGTSPDKTALRGHKLYWHKGQNLNVNASADERQHEKQLTRILPVKQGVRFSFKIHLENLREEELGALWWALTLPGDPEKEYRHKLGMAKPLGMGSIKIRPKLYLTNKKQRYTTLFSGKEWETATTEQDPDLFVKAFEHYLLHEQGLGLDLQHINELDRIQMLLTMLEWRDTSDEWLETTRYMEIEHGEKQVNEYKERPVLPNPFGILELPITNNRPSRPTPARDKPKPRHTSSQIQVGDFINTTVYYVEPERVHLEVQDSKLMGYIPKQKLGEKQYKEGSKATCLVLAIEEVHGETVLLCEPAGVGLYRGVVIKYDVDRNYGFIKPDWGGNDLYVNSVNLHSSSTTLKEGDPVEFRITKGPKGPVARNVRIVEENK